MTSDRTEAIGVLCVDDNPHVIDALRIMFTRRDGFAWEGSLAHANDMVATVERDCPGIVVLDLDMPGRDPFDATAELRERCPDTRVVFFTGHVRTELIERALDAGAWGYVSKNDGEEALIEAIRRVKVDEIAFSPEARRAYHER